MVVSVGVSDSALLCSRVRLEPAGIYTAAVTGGPSGQAPGSSRETPRHFSQRTVNSLPLVVYFDRPWTWPRDPKLLRAVVSSLVRVMCRSQWMWGREEG